MFQNFQDVAMMQIFQNVAEVVNFQCCSAFRVLQGCSAFECCNIAEALTLNRSGFVQIGMAGGGQILPPLCNFCLNGPIDLKFGM